MTTHDDEFAKKITGYLDLGTADLKAGTAYRLQQARAAALARLDAAGPGSAASRLALRPRRRRRIGWRPAAALRPASRLWLGIAAHRRGGASATSNGRPTSRSRTSRNSTPRSCRRTCRSTPIWTGDSRIGSRRASSNDRGARLGRPADARRGVAGAGADHAQVAFVVRAVAAGAPGAGAARAGLGQARRPAQAEMARNRAALSDDDARPAARVRDQMRSWAQLTPEQRPVAREQYKSLKTLPPEKKEEVRQRWEEYQSLPPEKRRAGARQPPPAGNDAAAGGPAHGNSRGREARPATRYRRLARRAHSGAVQSRTAGTTSSPAHRAERPPGRRMPAWRNRGCTPAG